MGVSTSEKAGADRRRLKRAAANEAKAAKRRAERDQSRAQAREGARKAEILEALTTGLREELERWVNA